MNDKYQTNIAYYMVILVTVLQIITTVGLLVLWAAFRKLKRDLHTFKDSLPLVNLTNSSPSFTLPVPTPSIPASSNPGLCPPGPSPPSVIIHSESVGSVVGNKQRPEHNEVIEVLPTPDPERRVTPLSSVVVATTPMKESTGKDYGFTFTSFTDFSRDSGIGSSSDRNQSTSSDSIKDVIRCDSNPGLQEKMSTNEEIRTDSNASRESNVSKPKRYSFQDYQNALQFVNKSVVNSFNETNNATANDDDNVDDDDDDDDDDDYRHLERLQTMAIEMIDMDNQTSARDKRKRASQILNEQALDSFINRGYSDVSMTSQPRAPLASEECSLSSDAHNVDENQNDVIEDEVYENQVIIDKHQLSVKM